MIGILRGKQLALGKLPDDAPDHDTHVILQKTITYLTNSVSRMDYPNYRRVQLPITSCLIGSLGKEMNHRVKGTEKFWNDGKEGAAILQMLTRLLSDDNRLKKYFQFHPGSLFARHPKNNVYAPA